MSADSQEPIMIHDMEMSSAEEVLACNTTATKADQLFDIAVGHLQEIAITPDFQQTRDRYLAQFAHEFDDSEENKLQYMPIFKDWTTLIESYLETHLTKAIPGFKMLDFIQSIAQRQDQIDTELFDMLASLADFSTFKEEILFYKQAQAQQQSQGLQDMSSCFVVHSM